MLSEACEPGVVERVLRQHRDAVAHHRVDDGAADRHLGRHRTVAIAHDARAERLVDRIAQQQERALGRHDFEHELDDARQHLFERLHRDQRLADLGEQPEQAAAAAIAAGSAISRRTAQIALPAIDAGSPFSGRRGGHSEATAAAMARDGRRGSGHGRRLRYARPGVGAAFGAACAARARRTAPRTADGGSSSWSMRLTMVPDSSKIWCFSESTSLSCTSRSSVSVTGPSVKLSPGDSSCSPVSFDALERRAVGAAGVPQEDASCRSTRTRACWRDISAAVITRSQVGRAADDRFTLAQLVRARHRIRP